MAKQAKRPDEPPRVEVEAVASFRHDGIERRPGARIMMSGAEAEDLIALGYAASVPPAYRDRAMRARSR